MSLKRYATRRDSNEPELVELARQCGAWMIKTDVPTDYLMGWGQQWFLVELKTATGKLTPAQQKLVEQADQRGLPVLVWRSKADVLDSLRPK